MSSRSSARSKADEAARAAQAASLPRGAPHRPRGTPRASRRGRWRVVALVAVHALFLVHLAHWKIAGTTLTPVEPSEAGQAIELGYVNAGLVLLVVLVLATLVLGRFFCGWACHVVAYQDACAWLLGRIGIRPKPIRSRLLAWVPLLAAAWMFVLPAAFKLWTGEPFQPLQVKLTTSDFWERFPGPLQAIATFAVCGFLIVYALGSKAFCTYGCPYGALFGISDRFARGRIRVTDACEGCGHCTATCTSNVRVHEEVARYAMVVDSGCMKCMDCVSVCPKDALYYGVGPGPAFGAGVARRYDFSWPEEIALAAAFALAFWVHKVLGYLPLLLVIGLAVLLAFAVLVLWRLARKRDFGWQHHALRRGGKLTLAGWIVALVAGGYVLWTAQSGVVSWSLREGEKLYHHLRVHALPPAEARAVVDESLAHFERADRLMLTGAPMAHVRLGVLRGAKNDFAGAEREFRAALELDPMLSDASVQLAGLRTRQGRVDEASLLVRDVLERDREHGLARNALFGLFAAHPQHGPTRYAAVEQLLHEGELESARTALAPLLEREPVPARAQELAAQIDARTR